MVRSLFSGVSGLKAHQTRLDVIGNNIANVNTYGFKSSRATFRDMYYQNIRGASAGTANRGGINPAAVGYGSSISSVDLLMTQSAMTPTGNPLDVCITGEGFLQVQDADGNIFYTKAGMLDIDANGNLIDSNGYFVLGTSGDPTGKAPGTSKIQFTIPPVDPSVATYEGEINGRKITVTTSNQTREGNVNLTFATATDLPLGKRAEAVKDGSSINVRINANEEFTSLADFNKAVNDAITEANGGTPHPAGNFEIKMEPDPFADGSLKGEDLTGSNFGYDKGSVTMEKGLYGGFAIKEVGNHFSGDGVGAVNYKLIHTAAAGDQEGYFTFEATVGGKTYTRKILESQMNASGSAVLVQDPSTDDEDSITISYPSLSSLVNIADDPKDITAGLTFNTYEGSGVTFTGDAVASTPSNDVGLASTSLKLEGGTEGGPQTIKDLSSISIGSDGTIVAMHSVHGRMTIGRIDLANFDNPQGLEQSGNSYFAATDNSGKPSYTVAGENGTGALKNSALEMSNVDLSQEFTDMITTQRGFQANSRIITVSDTMLEELINLKR